MAIVSASSITSTSLIKQKITSIFFPVWYVFLLLVVPLHVHASSRAIVLDVLAPTLLFFLVSLPQPVLVALPVELYPAHLHVD
jgi:hypothetical protein